MLGLLYSTAVFIVLTWIYYFLSNIVDNLFSFGLPTNVVKANNTNIMVMIVITGICLNIFTIGLLLGFDGVINLDTKHPIVQVMVSGCGILHTMLSVTGLGALVQGARKVKFNDFISYMYINTILEGMYLGLVAL